MPTTNYEWELPVVGGSTGSWGTILNALAEAIDGQVKTVEDKADVAVASLYGDFRIAALAAVEVLFQTSGEVPQWLWSSTNGRFTSYGSGGNWLFFRLPSLPVGSVLSAIRSYGHVSGTMTYTVDLVRVANDGSITVVSAGHALPTSAAETETDSIDHTILADVDYFIRVRHTAGLTASTALLKSVGYTVEAAA